MKLNGRWYIVAQETSILPSTKKDKHTKYRYSEKGRQRDYRRYKKILANRIVFKTKLVKKLEKELQ
jgi:hypothetical protein